jgi:hypothetical protein
VNDRADALARPPRPWRAFLAGLGLGLVILVLAQVLSETRLAFGPWALGGNGALAVPFIGIPLAIYAGWTALADRAAGRPLALAIASYSLGLAIGAGVLGVFFALPMALVTAAVYATFLRGPGRLPRRLLWAAYVVSALLAALPVLGLFGVGLLPGSLIALAHARDRRYRIALGALLALTATAIVFGAPALFLGPRQG